MTDARPDARPDRRCVRQNRCSHLIAESPTNAIGLERGRPLTLIPVPLVLRRFEEQNGAPADKKAP